MAAVPPDAIPAAAPILSEIQFGSCSCYFFEQILSKIELLIYSIFQSSQNTQKLTNPKAQNSKKQKCKNHSKEMLLPKKNPSKAIP